MKNIFIILIFMLISGIISCNKEPLGIEANVLTTRITPRDSVPVDPVDTVIKEIKTKFHADSMSFRFHEIYKINDGKDSNLFRWTPFNISNSAILDTIHGILRLTLDMNSYRSVGEDSLDDRKEEIGAIFLKLDSLAIKERMEFEKNNENYKSKIYLHFLPGNKGETMEGKYPITFVFKVHREDQKFIINGSFVIKSPIYGQQKKYDYYFHCEFTLRFPLTE